MFELIWNVAKIEYILSLTSDSRVASCSLCLREFVLPNLGLRLQINRPQHRELHSLVFSNRMCMSSFTSHRVLRTEGLRDGAYGKSSLSEKTRESNNLSRSLQTKATLSPRLFKRPQVLVRPPFWTRSGPKLRQLNRSAVNSVCWLVGCVYVQAILRPRGKGTVALNGINL